MHTSKSTLGVTENAATAGAAAFWDNIAESYARKPVADPVAFEKKIAITRGFMQPEHVVLDVGCGTGSLALLLAPHAKHVHGFDLSHEMIRIARAKAANTSNVTFHVGDWSAMPFEPETLNGVCAYSLLHLLPDPAAALTRIFRVLQPGGFFVASTVCLADSWVPYGVLLRAMRWVGKAPFVNLLSRADVLSHLERAGFVDIAAPDVGAKDQVLFTVARKPGAKDPGDKAPLR